jgi:hypothetical protein
VRPSTRPPAVSTMRTASRDAFSGSSAVMVTLPVTMTSRSASCRAPSLSPPPAAWSFSAPPTTPCSGASGMA